MISLSDDLSLMISTTCVYLCVISHLALAPSRRSLPACAAAPLPRRATAPRRRRRHSSQPSRGPLLACGRRCDAMRCAPPSSCVVSSSGYCRNEFSVVATTVCGVVPSKRRSRRRRLPSLSLTPAACVWQFAAGRGPPGSAPLTVVRPGCRRLCVSSSSLCAACRRPRARVQRHSRAHRRTRALRTSGTNQPSTKGSFSPKPPAARQSPQPDYIRTPIASPPCSGPLSWPCRSVIITIAVVVIPPHAVSSALCAPPVASPGTRRRSKEVTSLDAMFTKMHTRTPHSREGSPHTHKWH